MGSTVGNSYWELLVMLTLVITLGVASLAAGQLPDHLKALCPAYPNCDNALLAAYDKIHKASLIQAPAGAPQAPVQTSAELPCANYPFCDVNHAALAQGVPCANFPNCDVHHCHYSEGKERGTCCCSSDTWKHSRPRSWITCCCSMVGCSNCPPGCAGPSPEERGTCSCSSDTWKHSRPCSWITCCCSMVGCSTYPQRPVGSSCLMIINMV